MAEKKTIWDALLQKLYGGDSNSGLCQATSHHMVADYVSNYTAMSFQLLEVYI